MTSFESIQLSRGASNEGELRIVLDLPDTMNAWGKALGADLVEALRIAAEDDSVRAVTLTGAGRGFCSGADLKEGFELNDRGKPDLHGPLHERYHPVITAIRELPKPVLAAVNGPAVGVGCSLALACDLVAMRESAYLLLAFVNIGLVPDGGSSVFVPARAGFTRAAEMAMLGERIAGPQALEWGLVNRVWADDEFDAEVDRLAERLATGPTASYAGSKRQLNAWVYGGLQDQLALEAEVQQSMAESGDFQEGVGAFLAKRPAEFKGS